MRIWQYTKLDITSVGGVQKHIKEVSQALRSLDLTVHVGKSAPELIDGEPLIIHTHGDAWPHLPLFLKKLVNRKNVKWIQVCHGTSMGRLLACREYGSISGWKGTLRDFSLIHSADAAIAVGEQAKLEAQKFFRFKKPIEVIPNGVNTEVFQPLKKLSTHPRIAFLGRSEDRVKNFSTLVKACQIVYSKHEDFELWIAPGLNRTERFIKGFHTHSDLEVSKLLGQCRALVLCSFYEGDPLVVREAMALGMPIICSDIPPLRNTLNNYHNTFFINPRNVDGIAHTIDQVSYDQSINVCDHQSRKWIDVATECLHFYKRILRI